MNRLKELRGKKTQQEVSEAFGIKRGAYCTYELGTRNIPNKVLEKISEYYNVSIGYILGFEDEPLTIPEELKDVSVAFNGGLEGLTQEDIDDLAKYADYLKAKRKN